jgi:hypothetical protein
VRIWIEPGPSIRPRRQRTPRHYRTTGAKTEATALSGVPRFAAGGAARRQRHPGESLPRTPIRGRDPGPLIRANINVIPAKAGIQGHSSARHPALAGSYQYILVGRDSVEPQMHVCRACSTAWG